MAVRQIAINQMTHECRIIEDDTTGADAYGHNSSFSGAVRASNVACRYYEESNTERIGEIQGMVTISKLLFPVAQNFNAEDRIDSIVHKGAGTSVVSGTFEIISILLRPTHKVLTLRKVAQN
tara:strand:+ start:2828 stop:3193 length:366 start_codon:yes stop_codon:yes gene_type:complete